MEVGVCSRALELLQRQRERKVGDGTSLAAIGADWRAPPRHRGITLLLTPENELHMYILDTGNRFSSVWNSTLCDLAISASSLLVEAFWSPAVLQLFELSDHLNSSIVAERQCDKPEAAIDARRSNQRRWDGLDSEA